MEFGEQAIRWLELLIERRMLVIDVKGVHLATDDGTYWSNFSFVATYVQVPGGAIHIVYDKAKEDEEYERENSDE